MMSKTIMVVEDNQSFREFLARYLKMFGYNVISAENGSVALEILEEEKPDLIISDVMMPEMDGVQFYLVLKEREDLKSIPVIVLTVRDEFEDIRYASLLGIDRYLSKPFDPEELRGLLEEILGT
ncbi:MAG: response regulator [Candidatus Eremiobacteraeota bacterium]|nr:response regulator [Candidatus Eremiobacteraeota bacterium]